MKLQAVHRAALVASSDWHGWTGSARTWTLFYTASSVSAGTRSEDVIETLRRRDPTRIVPVVSQVMGRPTVLRGILAPFIETIRYARELPVLSVASWWIWSLVLLGLSRYLRRQGYHAGRCFAGSILVVVGAGMLTRGCGLLQTWLLGTPFAFPLKIAAFGCLVGLFSLLSGWVLLHPAIVTRSHKALFGRTP